MVFNDVPTEQKPFEPVVLDDGKVVRGIDFAPSVLSVDMVEAVLAGVPTSAKVYLRPDYGSRQDVVDADVVEIETDPTFALPSQLTGRLGGSWLIDVKDGRQIELPEGAYKVLRAGAGKVVLRQCSVTDVGLVFNTYWERALAQAVSSRSGLKWEQYQTMAYNAYIKVNPEAVSPAVFADAKPLICSTPDGLRYDMRSPEVMYYVCPTLGDVYAYS